MATVEGAERHGLWTGHGVFEVHDISAGVVWVWRYGRWMCVVDRLGDFDGWRTRGVWSWRSTSLPPPGAGR